MLNYNNKVFRSVTNSRNGEVSAETVFTYIQIGNIVTAVYEGGSIIKGSLIALMAESGKLDNALPAYQQPWANNDRYLYIYP